MLRTIFVLTLFASSVVACSQPAPQQTPPAGQATPAAPPNEQTPSTTSPRSAEDRPSPDAAAQPPSSQAAPVRGGVAPPAAQAPAAPVPPAAPTFREVTIPAGTTLSVTVLSTLASNTSKVEDPVKGSLAKAVTVSGTTALPAGTPLSGSVVEANESGRVKGRASLAFRFDRLVIGGEPMRIQTASVRREAAADTKSDVKKGGIGAGVGAIVGGVVGGGKGAAIGAVAGGTGAVLATKGKEVEIAPGTTVNVLLQDPLTVTVPVK